MSLILKRDIKLDELFLRGLSVRVLRDGAKHGQEKFWLPTLGIGYVSKRLNTHKKKMASTLVNKVYCKKNKIKINSPTALD